MRRCLLERPPKSFCKTAGDLANAKRGRARETPTRKSPPQQQVPSLLFIIPPLFSRLLSFCLFLLASLEFIIVKDNRKIKIDSIKEERALFDLIFFRKGRCVGVREANYKKIQKGDPGTIKKRGTRRRSDRCPHTRARATSKPRKSCDMWHAAAVRIA